ncbi:hypothetical protein BKH42_03670 [Helicobacter sp. 13S00482-2]|uniref:hypothetical protein n=1 Tax=Helicobacter sp. 13S00482-2 TaxID=1476200 RepID=UPI000BA51BC3|nr:hypothetical protein [Helicobacter sp. 13S00482-2]PAF53840.1 hypothetical protein BKH42_03670 [Helicobacter sp. 13S00482-2]
MIKKILLILLFITNAFAYYDFGVLGNTYIIEEPDALEEMKKAYEQTDKKALKKELIDEYKKNLVGNIHLPYCKKNSTRKIDLFNKRAPYDIDIEEVDIHIKAGTPLSDFYQNVHLKYALMNATSPDEFSWLKSQKVQNVIITEGILDELKKYSQKFILNTTLKDAFEFKCTPTIFEIKKGVLNIYEYEIKRKEEAQ